ncbi:uncharacterized protein TNCV_4190821 [Trichonephila clavipes]|nr:uncharacterized protein TNCV_4190821 [Trichonephila clavipes]
MIGQKLPPDSFWRNLTIRLQLNSNYAGGKFCVKKSNISILHFAVGVVRVRIDVLFLFGTVTVLLSVALLAYILRRARQELRKSVKGDLEEIIVGNKNPLLETASDFNFNYISKKLPYSCSERSQIVKKEHHKVTVSVAAKIISDEAHFWLNGYVNKQNCRIWSEANPQVYVETPLHPEKLTVWFALWAGGILLQKR